MVEVDPAWNWIWRAWWRLHKGDRPWLSGMEAAPMFLPWAIVQRWAEAEGYGPEQAKFMDACFSAMDEVFMEHFAEQQRIRRAKTT
jgi:hypothetical protein